MASSVTDEQLHSSMTTLAKCPQRKNVSGYVVKMNDSQIGAKDDYIFFVHLVLGPSVELYFFG